MAFIPTPSPAPMCEITADMITCLLLEYELRDMGVDVNAVLAGLNAAEVMKKAQAAAI